MSISTLRNLIEANALGINPNTPVALRWSYNEDVAHYNDDYQEDVFANSGLVNMITDIISDGTDRLMFNGNLLEAVRSLSDTFDAAESDESIPDAEEDDYYDFILECVSEAMVQDYYEFGVDSSLEQYDYKRGNYSIGFEVETTASLLLESQYNFAGFVTTVDTSVAKLILK
ncbi:MAG TPA: hypothetical protein EYQ00_03770 [Dehalococcoidia bacterium]|nr:hypothetical protein [Dehalococcoidia bacterium]